MEEEPGSQKPTIEAKSQVGQAEKAEGEGSFSIEEQDGILAGYFQEIIENRKQKGTEGPIPLDLRILPVSNGKIDDKLPPNEWTVFGFVPLFHRRDLVFAVPREKPVRGNHSFLADLALHNRNSREVQEVLGPFASLLETNPYQASVSMPEVGSDTQYFLEDPRDNQRYGTGPYFYLENEGDRLVLYSEVEVPPSKIKPLKEFLRRLNSQLEGLGIRIETNSIRIGRPFAIGSKEHPRFSEKKLDFAPRVSIYGPEGGFVPNFLILGSNLSLISPVPEKLELEGIKPEKGLDRSESEQGFLLPLSTTGEIEFVHYRSQHAKNHEAVLAEIMVSQILRKKENGKDYRQRIEEYYQDPQPLSVTPESEKDFLKKVLTTLETPDGPLTFMVTTQRNDGSYTLDLLCEPSLAANSYANELLRSIKGGFTEYLKRTTNQENPQIEGNVVIIKGHFFARDKKD